MCPVLWIRSSGIKHVSKWCEKPDGGDTVRRRREDKVPRFRGQARERREVKGLLPPLWRGDGIDEVERVERERDVHKGREWFGRGEGDQVGWNDGETVE
jgi:hypothetical protein